MPRPALPFLLFVLAVLPATAGTPASPLPDSVRIRILDRQAPDRITVTAPAGGLVVYDGTGRTELIAMDPGERAEVRTRRREVRLETGGRTVQGGSLRLVPPDEQTVTLDVDGQPRSYHGFVVVGTDPDRPSDLQIVNHVGLEEYVAAVVAAEYGLDDLEGAKAMAVVVRTYAARDAGREGTAYDHVDHEGSQVYRGAGSVTQIARLAATETRGEVLTYEGALIEAVYSASSGGHTASNEDVWNSAPVPYLRGRKDPWDEAAPHHEWTWTIDRKRLDGVLEDRFDTSPRSIRVTDRTPDGRARTVTLEARRGSGRTLSAAEFRSAVSAGFGPQALRSTLFDIREDGDTYVFEGRGYGHGVGMSQWGAHGMSRAGRSYREILDFYYTDTRLERLAPEAAIADWTVAGVAPPPPVMATVAADPSDSKPGPVRAASGETTRPAVPPTTPAVRSGTGRMQAWGGPRAPRDARATRRPGW